MVRQERIIVIEESEELTVITTTGFHIARRMGEAVSRAYYSYSITGLNGPALPFLWPFL